MRIIIETLPHQEQRYNTVGDWFYDEHGDLHIKISEMNEIRSGRPDPARWNEREMCLIIHELTEALLCRKAGISQDQVDEFDKRYERSLNMQANYDEPGDHPEAPYKHQHCVATGVERIIAAELGVDWAAYERNIEKLSDSYPKERK